MLKSVQCAICEKDFERQLRRYNEAVKFGWKQFCSPKCLSVDRVQRQTVYCENLQCRRKLSRSPHEISLHNYCSHSCAMRVLNLARVRLIRICPKCNKKFTGENKYCSAKCIPKTQIKYSDEFLLKELSEFYRINQRIPTKRDFINNYGSFRRAFGTWNQAIKAAGFEPNPVLFAKKYIANDGHKCDSLSERIIDDWLFRRKIKHERSFPYPGEDKFTVDFKIGDYWIEFFGLSGELKRYDELKNRKLKLAKTLKLKLVAIYPEDLFPVGHIEDKLNFLL